MVGLTPERELTKGRSVPQEDARIDGTLLDAVLSRLVPHDEHGADARELGLHAFILARLSGARRADVGTYAAGLRELDLRARGRHGRGFAALTDDERDEVLADLEFEEAQLPPWTRGDAFLETVLRDVREGMFGDPSYGGNREARGWDLLGYPDPRHTWTAADQRMDVVIVPLLPRRARPPASAPR